MIIAVNTRSLLKDHAEKYQNFIYECFIRITRQQIHHTFIFIFDRQYDPSIIFSENVIPVITGPKVSNTGLLWIWLYIKVPLILKKYKADVFVSSDGFCSSSTQISQLIVTYDQAFYYPAFFKKNNSFAKQKLFSSSLRKSKIICTWSEFSKKDISKTYKIDERKIEVVYTGLSDFFKPVEYEEREKIKDQYADGNEYFLFMGVNQTKKNLIDLLKAFAIFKKRQKSSMQLLMVNANNFVNKNELAKNLRLYKFREDVKLLENLSQIELVRAMAAAYVIIYLSLVKDLHIPLIEAMKCDVPVITNSIYAISEICGDAALYVNYDDDKDIANKIMMIFKDEVLRAELILKGKNQAKKYSWENTSSLLWQSITKSRG